MEKVLRRLFPETKTGERVAGTLLAVSVAGCSAVVPAAVLFVCYRIHPLLGILLESLMCGMLLAAKSLKKESMKVAEALETEGLEAGRKAVSMIVGRDTAQLDETGVVKAAVETVAENTSDGIVAPMCFMALLGGAGLWKKPPKNLLHSGNQTADCYHRMIPSLGVSNGKIPKNAQNQRNSRVKYPMFHH